MCVTRYAAIIDFGGSINDLLFKSWICFQGSCVPRLNRTANEIFTLNYAIQLHFVGIRNYFWILHCRKNHFYANDDSRRLIYDKVLHCICNGSLTVHIATAETLSLLGGSRQATRQMHLNDPYLDCLETDLQSVPSRHSHVSILTSI